MTTRKQASLRWRLREEFFRSVRSRALTEAHEALERDCGAFREEHKGNIGAYGPKKFAKMLSEFSSLCAREEYLDSYYELLVQENHRNRKKVRPGKKRLEKITRYREELQEEISAIPKKRIAYLLGSHHMRPYRNWIRQARTEKHITVEETSGEEKYLRMVRYLTQRARLGDEKFSKIKGDTSHMDDEVRHAAFEKKGQVMARVAPRAARYYNEVMAEMHDRDKEAGYKRADKAFCLDNDITVKAVDRMVSAIRSRRKLAHAFYAQLARQHGKKTISPRDFLKHLPGEAVLTMSWYKARRTILNAYRRFSKEFQECARQFFDNSWIDAQKRPYKDAATFCQLVNAQKHAFIQLDGFDDSLPDAINLTHELGHGVHDTLAAPRGQLGWNPPATLKETASQFAEMLVFDEILRTHENPKTRKYVLWYMTERITDQIFGTAAEAFFEREVHAARRAAGRNLSEEKISSIWVKNQKEFHGPAVESDKSRAHDWIDCDQIYERPFYSYSYIFGQALVLALYDMYRDAPNKKEFVAKYMDLLRAGGSEPLDVALKRFGLDPAGNEIWDRAFEVYEDLLGKLEALDRKPTPGARQSLKV